MPRTGTESDIINKNYNEEVIFGPKKSLNSGDSSSQPKSSFKTTEHQYFYEDYAPAESEPEFD